MKDYVIFTDSTCDLPSEICGRYSLGVVPMDFRLGISAYTHHSDFRELGMSEFYERLRHGESFSTAPGEQDAFLSCFTPVLEAGRDILYIAFSSALSNTYGEALLAARGLMERFPGRAVVCIDSRAASLGEGMLAVQAAQKRAEGMPLDALASWLTMRRGNCAQWFSVNDARYLKRGGRAATAAAAFSCFIHKKPVLHVDISGFLSTEKNVWGRRASMKALLEALEYSITAPETQDIYIGHSDCLADAEHLRQLVLARFAVKSVNIAPIGPMTGGHAGPGTIALFFTAARK